MLREMNIAELIATLGLAPHPEGGFYRETFRSPRTLADRSASTAIYYLLPAGAVSLAHRVRSDEVWPFYDGAPLELHTFGDEGHRITLLGRELTRGERPQAVVPANVIQAARPLGRFALVGCTVAPGFDFADFELI